MVSGSRYREIADDLRRKINSGDLPAGAKLPTETDLCQAYGASRNTIREAIKLLVTRHLVKKTPGSGTFVLEPVSPWVHTISEDPNTGFGGGEGRSWMAEVESRGRVPSMSEVDVQIVQPSPEVAEALGLEVPQTADARKVRVIKRSQELFVDGSPSHLQTTYYPDLRKQGAEELEGEDLPDGMLAYLSRTLGIKQVGWIDRFELRQATEAEEAFFHLRDDAPRSVLEQRRRSYDQAQRPFRLTVTVYQPGTQFEVVSGKVPDEVRAFPPRHRDIEVPP
ncbi:GntR family transcriptional regulator [Actinoplanes octamycinicus]|uniref:GntR family transcriptional regulator n=1 Tax=Actinoplanes octamycinicus TaxID=135948 RepID=A0A7W7H7H6_9ACTN|nr:GntR family transcriptional regulator [Actinoplanes octamycinicus]MBB4745391.1 GntR family transcriptional regulator [Actinoplanes octamycinicus]